MNHSIVMLDMLVFAKTIRGFPSFFEIATSGGKGMTPLIILNTYVISIPERE
jgi:hypothetical protein